MFLNEYKTRRGLVVSSPVVPAIVTHGAVPARPSPQEQVVSTATAKWDPRSERSGGLLLRRVKVRGGTKLGIRYSGRIPSIASSIAFSRSWSPSSAVTQSLCGDAGLDEGQRRGAHAELLMDSDKEWGPSQNRTPTMKPGHCSAHEADAEYTHNTVAARGNNT